MKRNSQAVLSILGAFLLSCSISVNTSAQGMSKIDFSRDTISKFNANAQRNHFINNVTGKATPRISLPVDKLKEIMDACSANGISEVDVLIGKIRDLDINHYKKFNANANDAQLLGSQIIIIRVPRRAFAGKMAASINLSNSNPLMLSLLSAGLVMVDAKTVGITETGGDIYFSFGGICPPPNSCD